MRANIFIRRPSGGSLLNPELFDVGKCFLTFLDVGQSFCSEFFGVGKCFFSIS
jgi:hypothetical protein